MSRAPRSGVCLRRLWQALAAEVVPCLPPDRLQWQGRMMPQLLRRFPIQRQTRR